MSNKSSITQFLANFYPSWSKTRLDDQSLGFRILNVFGTQLEDLDRQLQTIGKNYYLTTANLEEIDIVERLQLPKDFEFQVDETDPANPIFTSPTVSGLIETTWHDVSQANNNDIETFWYTSVPTRIDTDVTTSGNHVVLSGVSISESPISTFDNDLHMPGRLHVQLEGGSKYIDSVNNEIIRGTVIITGTNRHGVEDTETMIFLFDSTQTTQTEWDSLDEVRVYSVDPDTTTLSIYAADYSLGPYRDYYNLEVSVEGNKVDTFWNPGVTVSGSPTLDMMRYTVDSFTDIVFNQVTDLDIIRQTELLDTSGTSPVPSSIVDIAIQPFSSRIWVATTSGLYLYDTDQYMPSLDLAPKKNENSPVALLVDNHYKVLYDEIELEYFYINPVKDIGRHRLTIEKPDGTKVGLLDGAEVSTTTDYWQYDTGQGRSLRPSDILTLDQRGDWVFTLEVDFTDSSRTTDQRIVTVDSKAALAEFNLPFTVSGLSFSSDQELWALDDAGVHHRIDLRTDNMLVDFQQKVIFLHEKYDEVKVTS